MEREPNKCDNTSFISWFLCLYWVFTLHLAPRVSFDRQQARLLAYWRFTVLNHVALLSKASYAALDLLLESGVDLPSLIYMWAAKSHKCPLLIPRLPGRKESDMEYARCREIANMINRWKSSQAKNLRGRWQAESSTVSFWWDGRVKKITRSWVENVPYGINVMLTVGGRRVSEPAITVSHPSWVRGTRDTASLGGDLSI